MGQPSLLMSDVLEAIKSKISDNLSSGESVEIAPALIPKQYTAVKYSVCPVDIEREYTNVSDGSDTIVIPRCIVRIWASIGLIGGEDGSFEYAVIGITADNKKGVTDALEWVEGILRDYFMESEDVQSFKFEYDKPTFTVVDAGNNQAALAGSFRVVVTGSMTPAAETPLMYGTRTMAAKVPFVLNVQVTEVDNDSATITWTTNFPSTSFVEYSAGSGNPLSNQTSEDTTLTTNHEVTVTGLNAQQYYEFRPCSRDPNSTRVGKSHDRYNFTTTSPPLTIEDVVFDPITENSIKCSYRAKFNGVDEPVNCYISFKKSIDPFWQQKNFTPEHDNGPHAHTISNLQSQTEYWLRIKVTMDEGYEAYSPSETGYYRIMTGTESSSGYVIGIFE